MWSCSITTITFIFTGKTQNLIKILLKISKNKEANLANIINNNINNL